MLPPVNTNLDDLLRLRANWLRKIRNFFDSRDFVEVQTPVLSRDTVIDRHIDPISVDVPIQGLGNQQFWLQTSPEFCLKRLLAGGAKAIYEITPAFRGGEIGDRHNIEFTMLEWYRVGDDYQDGIDLLDEFSIELLKQRPAKRISYREAFRQFAGVDPFDVDVSGQTNTDKDEWLNLLMSEKVEPALAKIGSVIIFDWPASQSALAKTRKEQLESIEVEFAERFELYIDGIELANGYHELTDAEELLARNQLINHQRAADHKIELPVSSQLIEAMRTGLPNCSGVALGFDRMLMLMTQAQTIDEVLPIPGKHS